MPICECQKPQLTGIPCNHVLAVCFIRRLQPNDYVSSYYSLQNYINTWSGVFHSFGNERDWPLYEGLIIRPDPTKVNKGTRKHKRIPMEMDRMEAPTRRGRGRQQNQEWTTGAWTSMYGLGISKFVICFNVFTFILSF